MQVARGFRTQWRTAEEHVADQPWRGGQRAERRANPAYDPLLVEESRKAREAGAAAH